MENQSNDLNSNTEGKKEEELADLKKAIKKAKGKYGVTGVVTGELHSEYQSERIKRICRELKMNVYSPLWHMNQEKELNELLDRGYEFVFTRIAAEGLDKTWLGRAITKKDVKKLAELSKKWICIFKH